MALPTRVAHSYLAERVDRYENQLQDGAVMFLKSVGFQTKPKKRCEIQMELAIVFELN